MSLRWELPKALSGGTLAMREGGRKWLPQEPKEKNDQYNNRLSRTVLFEAYPRTVQALVGLAFHRAALINNVPSELEYIEHDADSFGSSITEFANTLLTDMVGDYGMSHVYIDMPSIDSNRVGIKDKSDKKIRPRFVHISPDDLISFKTRVEGGAEVLSEIRVKSSVELPDGDWGTITRKQVKHITEDFITVYQENDQGNMEKLGSPEENELGYIPLVTVYGNRTGFMTATPPLEGLAWLNLRHYQKLSDVDNIEHVANVPILLATGVEEGKFNAASIGPNIVITLSEIGADLKYVEHTGSAIGASHEAIDSLEQRMGAMGADFIVRKSVDRQTATARMLDSSESISLLQIMINNLERGIENMYQIAGDWEDVDASPTVSIGTWLDAGNGGPNFIDLLTNYLIENNQMPFEEAVNELKRRGSLSDTFEKADVISVPKEVVEPQE